MTCGSCAFASGGRCMKRNELVWVFKRACTDYKAVRFIYKDTTSSRPDPYGKTITMIGAVPLEEQR